MENHLNAKSFASYLKEYRSKNNITLIELSEMTGVSQPYLSQLEGGKIPSRKLINKIAIGMVDPQTIQGELDPEIIQAILENEMLELAGYKVIPEPGDNGYEEYKEFIEEYRITQSYESKINELNAKIEFIENNVLLDKLIDDNIKITLDNQELSQNEKIALNFFLMGLREIRNNKNN